MSKLVICEKPSVAKSIASALGVTSRADGYFEGGGWLISWCIGHLVGLADAAAYDDRYKKWRYEDLPILPAPFRYVVSEEKAAQFHILRSLMERPDVTELVNACDAGREGELIFRLVYEAAGCSKPFSRLWISSMEDAAIREGFADLRPGADYDPLYQSALCRQKADWLIGINASRLFSVLYHRTLNVGRVQTPTLAMLADRDSKIVLFRKEKYHHVRLTLEGAEAVSDRIVSPEDAQAIRDTCDGQRAVCVSLVREKKAEKPPKLYDLTTLQREANRVFGYTAKQTLDYAQSLYEKKLLTYPRTDSRYLPGDMAETASVTEHFTSPPKPYTEDTLLSAMENAGKEDMPEDAERKGLGTPATRAAIIEKLVSGGFVERKGKNLIPTKAGVNLVTVLPELLTSPKLTADWEQRLNEVAKGQASPEDFMDGIEAMAAELVRKYSHISEDGQKLFQPEKETVGLCPRCGKPVYEGKKNFACSDRACQFVMWKNDRFWTSRRKEMTPKMAADLLKKGRTSVKGMWSEKKGSTYDAVVILDDTGGKYVNFKLEFPKRKDGVHGKK